MRTPEQIAREAAERIVPPAAALTATLSERRSDVEHAKQIILAAIREVTAHRERELEEEVVYLRQRMVGSDDQMIWLADWCKKTTGIENNEVIGHDDWPKRLVEVVAMAVDKQLAAANAEIERLSRRIEQLSKFVSEDVT